jgi:hypothetical protein
VVPVTCEHDQVLRVVVCPDAVEVMDHLARSEQAPHLLFRDDAMLGHVAVVRGRVSRHVDSRVAAYGDRSSAAPLGRQFAPANVVLMPRQEAHELASDKPARGLRPFGARDRLAAPAHAQTRRIGRLHHPPGSTAKLSVFFRARPVAMPVLTV